MYLAPGDVEHGLLKIQDIGGDVMDALQMGQHWPQPVGMARSSSSKYISMRCLLLWRPHGRKLHSCLYFLDVHSSHQPDVQYWKYAVTGCSLITELKVWSSAELGEVMEVLEQERLEEEASRTFLCVEIKVI
jgi:hypothetical protein